jgi:hypothetical protein
MSLSASLAAYSLGFGGVAGAGALGGGWTDSGAGGAAAAAGGAAGGVGAVGAVDDGTVGAGADAVLVTGRFGHPASNRADVKPHSNSRAGRTGLFIVGWLLH